MRSALFLIRVSRPVLWPVMPLVYLLGLHAARGQVTVAVVAQLLTLTLPMNLVGCGLNDIYDFESDRLSNRRQRIWGTVVGPWDRSLVRGAVVAIMPLVVLGALLTRNADNVVATICLLLLAWGYSVPPVRLKERPPLDSIANGLGFFYLPFVMGYSLGAEPREMPLKYYLLALAVCGVHALAAAADYDADREAGHRTLAVAYGRRTAAAAALATFLIACLLGDFHSVAVRVYLALCAAAALVPVVVPRERPITLACEVIFAGFPVAAVCYLVGW